MMQHGSSLTACYLTHRCAACLLSSIAACFHALPTPPPPTTQALSGLRYDKISAVRTAAHEVAQAVAFVPDPPPQAWSVSGVAAAPGQGQGPGGADVGSSTLVPAAVVAASVAAATGTFTFPVPVVQPDQRHPSAPRPSSTPLVRRASAAVDDGGRHTSPARHPRGQALPAAAGRHAYAGAVQAPVRALSAGAGAGAAGAVVGSRGASQASAGSSPDSARSAFVAAHSSVRRASYGGTAPAPSAAAASAGATIGSPEGNRAGSEATSPTMGSSRPGRYDGARTRSPGAAAAVEGAKLSNTSSLRRASSGTAGQGWQASTVPRGFGDAGPPPRQRAEPGPAMGRWPLQGAAAVPSAPRAPARYEDNVSGDEGATAAGTWRGRDGARPAEGGIRARRLAVEESGPQQGQQQQTQPRRRRQWALAAPAVVAAPAREVRSVSTGRLLAAAGRNTEHSATRGKWARSAPVGDAYLVEGVDDTCCRVDGWRGVGCRPG